MLISTRHQVTTGRLQWFLSLRKLVMLLRQGSPFCALQIGHLSAGSGRRSVLVGMGGPPEIEHPLVEPAGNHFAVAFVQLDADCVAPLVHSRP